MDNNLISVPERFKKPYEIPREKLEGAIKHALNKLENGLPRWAEHFISESTRDFKYKECENNHWCCGLHTGLHWLAYELSGNQKFYDAAQKHLLTYQERYDNKVRLDDHDVGFVYSPSCVAAYKITGDENIRKLALDAAEYLYSHSYTQKGGFILRQWTRKNEERGCRTMMDTLLNAPLLFWAGQETGKQEYIDAAISQNHVTQQYLIREDGSSFHHYQFEPGTYKPVKGVTWQGYSDDSAWARGQAWGVYGFAIAYDYCKDPSLIETHKAVTNYMLSRLPEDLIPYWDLIFTEGSTEPRDSSAGAAAVCGMLEMSKHLPEDAPEKQIYKSAAAQMLEAVIDRCAGDNCKDYDGLICHVTHALPQGIGIDECASYGDYFYLEALMRFYNPTWERYW